jgi:hypothetical protein
MPEPAEQIDRGVLIRVATHQRFITIAIQFADQVTQAQRRSARAAAVVNVEDAALAGRHHAGPSRLGKRSRTNTAGLPAQIWSAGMSRATTEPAPTTARSPMVTPLRMIE